MTSGITRLSAIFAAATLVGCATVTPLAAQTAPATTAPSTITIVKPEVAPGIAAPAPKAEEPKKAELPPFPLTKQMLDDTDGGKRVVRLEGGIDAKSSAAVIAELIRLDREAPGKPILLAINSPGGSVRAGLNIIDVMGSLQSPVYTTCYNMCASMAGVILVAGESGHRSAFPNSDIMLHELSAQGIGGKISEQEVILAEEKRDQDKLLTVLAEHSGQNKEDILRFINGKDRWLTPGEAKKLGFIDDVEKPSHPVVVPPHIQRIRTFEPPVPASP
jgi:ATP-dependent Clp protease, protease subunit